MQREYSQHILLTGAGFTKNFGGLLAKEMWSIIFNKIQSYPRLKKVLFDNPDYESIYYEVMTGDYDDEERSAIDVAIFDAYRILEDIVCACKSGNGIPNIYGVNKMIERFCGSRDELGFFFTLNQDLFVERHFNSTLKMLIHPGVPRIPDAHKIINRLPMDKEDFILVPTNDQLRNKPINIVSNTTLHYVKLHGSFGWLSSNGSNCYVIGRKKEEKIADEPLLSWYFDLFTDVLSMPNRKLFVIGYGFQDSHVNEIIARSINNSNLKLYVVSPSPQSKLFSTLGEVEHGESILNGLSGYFPCTLLDIFPSDQSETHYWREIVKCYFTK